MRNELNRYLLVALIFSCGFNAIFFALWQTAQWDLRKLQLRPQPESWVAPLQRPMTVIQTTPKTNNQTNTRTP